MDRWIRVKAANDDSHHPPQIVLQPENDKMITASINHKVLFASADASTLEPNWRGNVKKMHTCIQAPEHSIFAQQKSTDNPLSQANGSTESEQSEHNDTDSC